MTETRVCCSTSEAASELDVDSVVERVLSLGPELVALTQGSGGAVLQAGTHRVHVPGVQVTVADTIGAGDTFMAALIRSVRARTR